MKNLLFFAAVLALFACNNSKKDPAAETNKSGNNADERSAVTQGPATPSAGEAGVVYTADGVEIKHSASILVTRDKGDLQAEEPFLCILTSNAATNNNEYVSVNFLLDTKPGIYPVVGCSFQRGKSPNDEMYGGLLGGKPKITEYKVTITECKDLGSNNLGGHKWSISGYWDKITIKATPMMLIDNTTKHPAEVNLGKGTFSNLTFDDNWDKMLEEGMKKMKEK